MAYNSSKPLSMDALKVGLFCDPEVAEAKAKFDDGIGTHFGKYVIGY